MTDEDYPIPSHALDDIVFNTADEWANLQQSVNANRIKRLTSVFNGGTLTFDGTTLTWDAPFFIYFFNASDGIISNNITAGSLAVGNNYIIWVRLSQTDTATITLQASAFGDFSRSVDLINQTADILILGVTWSVKFLPIGWSPDVVMNLQGKTSSLGIVWSDVDKTTSSLANITTRNHADLENKNGETDVKHLTAAQVAALHTKYTNTEAVNAMGTLGDTNPLNHDKYTNSNAVSAMGTKSDSNSLNHDKYTDTKARAAVLFQPMAPFFWQPDGVSATWGGITSSNYMLQGELYFPTNAAGTKYFNARWIVPVGATTVTVYVLYSSYINGNVCHGTFYYDSLPFGASGVSLNASYARYLTWNISYSGTTGGFYLREASMGPVSVTAGQIFAMKYYSTTTTDSSYTVFFNIHAVFS